MAVDALFTYQVQDETRYQAFLDKVLPLTQDEEYVLSYEIFKDESSEVYYQHERYIDEASFWKHMEVIAASKEDFSAAVDMISVVILGEVSSKFKETLGVKQSFEAFRSVKR